MTYVAEGSISAGREGGVWRDDVPDIVLRGGTASCDTNVRDLETAAVKRGGHLLHAWAVHGLGALLFWFLKYAWHTAQLAPTTGRLWGVEPGRAGGVGPLAVSGADEPSVQKDRRTSPSHRFLPFLQLVHARAPRFGMWTD